MAKKGDENGARWKKIGWKILKNMDGWSPGISAEDVVNMGELAIANRKKERVVYVEDVIAWSRGPGRIS